MKKAAKQIRLAILPILICFLILTSLYVWWRYKYRYTTYKHISAFSQIMIKNHPELRQEILASLKEYHETPGRQIMQNTFLSEYGYLPNEFRNRTADNDLPLFAISYLLITFCFVISFRKIHKDEHTRIAELTDYLEKVNTGNTKTIIQMSEDAFSPLQDEIYKTVTTLYQTREQAIQTKQNYADNLVNIAHQLKTPITAATLSLQLMDKHSPNDCILSVQKQLSRLNTLEESLLTLSKIDTGTLAFDHSSVDVYTALCLAAENLSDLLQKNGITVQIPEKGSVEIRGDLEWTMEAFLNLIKNCMEHSVQSGTIYCDYSKNPLYVEITIWDEGPGFDASDLPHLFERFYQGKNAVRGGIGIGLALAKSIFELENGTIHAHNLSIGGACFEIRIYSH